MVTLHIHLFQVPDQYGTIRAVAEGKAEQFLVGTSRNFILRGTFNDGFQIEVQVSYVRPAVSAVIFGDTFWFLCQSFSFSGSYRWTLGPRNTSLQRLALDMCSGQAGVHVELRGAQAGMDQACGCEWVIPRADSSHWQLKAAKETGFRIDWNLCLWFGEGLRVGGKCLVSSYNVNLCWRSKIARYTPSFSLPLPFQSWD